MKTEKQLKLQIHKIAKRFWRMTMYKPTRYYLLKKIDNIKGGKSAIELKEALELDIEATYENVLSEKQLCESELYRIFN